MTELKDYQKEGVRGIYKCRGKCLLADEQGLGKTHQALSWILKIPSFRPVVIICPASVKYTWQAIAAQHFGMRVEVLDGMKPKRTQQLPGNLLVVNYDILTSWLPLLLKAAPQVIVFDEAQMCANFQSQRSQSVFALCQQARSVVGLSGTPFTNEAEALWSVLQMINPKLFPDYTKFVWRYCNPQKTYWGWRFKGAKRIRELNQILESRVMIRRLKSEVEKELPTKIRKTEYFKLNNKQRSEYTAAQRTFLQWLRKRSPARAARARKSPALAKVGYLVRLAAEFKRKQMIAWIRDFLKANPGEKLVGLTMHKEVIRVLQKEFKHVLFIDGSITGRKRFETIRQFQSNKRYRLLVGNWKAVVGITLTASCHAVGLDLPWTPGDLLQGEDRLHRIGQKRNVLITYLIAMGTIEEALLKSLHSKSKILDAVLNGKRLTGADFTVFEDLFRSMLKEQL